MSMSAVSDMSDMSYSSTEGTEFQTYRAISRSAVIAAVLAVLASLVFVFAFVSVFSRVGDAVPLGTVASLIGGIGFVLGLTAVFTIRRYPAEYTGLRLAYVAVLASFVALVGGASAATYTYATEVPEGYTRLGFYDLQPDPEFPELPIPPKAIESSGKRVFIKGYMHPGVAGGATAKVNHFILVPDMGTCCFGGQPKPTDMIEVHIPPSQSGVAYSTRTLKLAGTFTVNRYPTDSLGLNNVWYYLEVDQVR